MGCNVSWYGAETVEADIDAADADAADAVAAVHDDEEEVVAAATAGCDNAASQQSYYPEPDYDSCDAELAGRKSEDH